MPKPNTVMRWGEEIYHIGVAGASPSGSRHESQSRDQAAAHARPTGWGLWSFHQPWPRCCCSGPFMDIRGVTSFWQSKVMLLCGCHNIWHCSWHQYHRMFWYCSQKDLIDRVSQISVRSTSGQSALSCSHPRQIFGQWHEGVHSPQLILGHSLGYQMENCIM